MKYRIHTVKEAVQQETDLFSVLTKKCVNGDYPKITFRKAPEYDNSK